MKILSIDPGPVTSAFVLRDGDKILRSESDVPNEYLRDILVKFDYRVGDFSDTDIVVCEMVACYGMPVGKEIFETVQWIGRFRECVSWNRPRFELVFRKDIKLHLCGSLRAKDANVRQSLIDRIGPPGTKKAPGPTYGVKSHAWQALAVAVYAQDVFGGGK